MLLELERVEKSYPSSGGNGVIQVLKNISLKVEAGESISIMGPSGSGKSTLLNIMGALDRPTAGTVRISGRDIGSLADAELAHIRNREVGFVFQLHHLLPQCTVLENVLIPTLAGKAAANTAEDEKRAERLLSRVGLSARLKHVPGRLSAGECQRAALVRALINRPKLLLADEPTGSLDRISAEALAKLLTELNREEGVALIVVTHSPALAAQMARRFSLDGGILT